MPSPSLSTSKPSNSLRSAPRSMRGSDSLQECYARNAGRSAGISRLQLDRLFLPNREILIS